MLLAKNLGSEQFQRVTSLLAHWKPATTLSLISFRYCTPLVQSTTMLGPVPSGPKHQILRASVTSKSYVSAKYLALSLASCLTVIFWPWKNSYWDRIYLSIASSSLCVHSTFMEMILKHLGPIDFPL
jgi:hypothetical protein